MPFLIMTSLEPNVLWNPWLARPYDSSTDA